MKNVQDTTNDQNSPIIDRSELCFPQEEEIDLMKLFLTVWRWKWLIGGFTFMSTVVAVAVTLFVLPVLYTSNVVIQPLNATTGQMTKIMAFASQLMPSALPQSSDKTQVMLNYLNSRQLQQNIIEKFDLLKRYNPDKWDEKNQKWLSDDPKEIPNINKMLQRRSLKKYFVTEQNSDSGLISISFTDEDPEFAVRVVSWVANELDRYLNEDFITDAKRNRIFVEKQLEDAKIELKYWERRIPAEGLTANEIAREIQAGVLVYTELKKQYELSKIEEDKQLVAFKVLDPAIVPVDKSSPERTKICGLTMIITFFFGVLLSFVFDAFYNLRRKQIIPQ